ncbi:hypothetical protein E4U11_000539, partial [Claviceps purpurea]
EGLGANWYLDLNLTAEEYRALDGGSSSEGSQPPALSPFSQNAGHLAFAPQGISRGNKAS